MDIYSSKKKARHAKKKTKPKHENTSGLKKKSIFEGKNKKAVITLIVAVSVLAAILLAMVIWVVVQFVGLKNAADRSHDSNFGQDEYFTNLDQKDDKIYNIALFGIDTRDPDSYSGRSDSIMVLSIDTVEKEIKLISLMRDTLVPITHEGKTTYGKLNTAYAKGGAALAVKTINENFGLDISEYATVNFYGMADIIDELGGIEIDVQQKEIDSVNGMNQNMEEQAGYLGVKPQYITKAGKQTLTGLQAVAWARIRSVSTAEGVSNDFGRTDRQRVVMEALLNKALDKNILQYPDIAKTMLGYVKTSLSFDEMWSLATSVLSKGVEFKQTRVPQTKYIINAGLSVPSAGSTVYFNLDFAKDILDAYIYEDIDQEDYLENNKIIKDGWYTGPVSTPSKTPDPENPVTDTSSVDTPTTDTSSTDSPTTDTSSTDSPTTDTSSTDTSSTDSPSTDVSSSDTASTTTPSSETTGTGDQEQTPAA